MADHRFELHSGRRVGTSAAGDPLATRLVVLCHPTPGAGGFDPDPVVSARAGVHLVMLDRPGYGASDAIGRYHLRGQSTIEQRADDIAEYVARVADAASAANGTKFASIGVIGWGTGGMVALSLAARRPGLVDRLAIVGTPAPRAAKAHAHPPFSLGALGIDSDDPALDRPGVGNRVGRMLADAAMQGEDGVAADRTAIRNTTWTGHLERITAPTLLIYGDTDRRAQSAEDGRWYRRRIPGARVVRVLRAGRLAIVSEWERILLHVAPAGAVPGSPGRAAAP